MSERTRIDYDALVAPIEQAATAAEARSAVWAALRLIKHHYGDLDAVAVIDAAVWTAGLSEGFRANAVKVSLDPCVWHHEDYRVISSGVGAAVCL